MVGIDHAVLISSGGNQGTASQMIGFSKQPAGALVDSVDGILIKKILINACDAQVVFEVILHAGKISACRWLRATILEASGADER